METFLQLLDPKDILFHCINAVILIVAMRFLLYKPVRKFMAARDQALTDRIDLAQSQEEQAQHAVLELEDAQRQAKQEAAQAESLRLSEQSQALLHQAHEQADEILARARLSADEIRQQAREDVQRQAVAMAVQVTEQMLGRELQDPDNQQMVRDFLTKVG